MVTIRSSSISLYAAIKALEVPVCLTLSLYTCSIIYIVIDSD